MKKLYLSFAPTKNWRSEDKHMDDEWRQLRLKILERDDYTCQYCGFRAEKWQIVHHTDGNPKNDKDANLETICPMCNLIHHSGQGCVVQKVVDLYKKSNYSQNEIIQITRGMRAENKADYDIIHYLGLKEKMPYKKDISYLKKLYGFVSSRKTKDWIQKALEYGYKIAKEAK